jgi:two-component system OmpR family response regulator
MTCHVIKPSGGAFHRALVLDQNPEIAELAVTSLLGEGFSVEVATSGEEGIEAALTRQHDVIVLEADLPDSAGVDVVRKLRAVGLLTAIVFFAREESLEARLAGLSAGADDYVAKSTSPAEFIARVQTVIRRANPPAPEVLRFADLVLDTKKHEARRAGALLGLSPTQYEVLRYLMTRPNQVISKDTLRCKVWGQTWDDDPVNDNVVEVCVSRVRAALVQHGPQLIRTVRSRGYALELPDKG